VVAGAPVSGTDGSSCAAARAITSRKGGEVGTGDAGACEADSPLGQVEAPAATTWRGGEEDICEPGTFVVGSSLWCRRQSSNDRTAALQSSTACCAATASAATLAVCRPPGEEKLSLPEGNASPPPVSPEATAPPQDSGLSATSSLPPAKLPPVGVDPSWSSTAAVLPGEAGALRTSSPPRAGPGDCWGRLPAIISLSASSCRRAAAQRPPPSSSCSPGSAPLSLPE